MAGVHKMETMINPNSKVTVQVTGGALSGDGLITIVARQDTKGNKTGETVRFLFPQWSEYKAQISSELTSEQKEYILGQAIEQKLLELTRSKVRENNLGLVNGQNVEFVPINVTELYNSFVPAVRTVYKPTEADCKLLVGGLLPSMEALAEAIGRTDFDRSRASQQLQTILVTGISKPLSQAILDKLQPVFELASEQLANDQCYGYFWRKWYAKAQINEAELMDALGF